MNAKVGKYNGYEISVYEHPSHKNPKFSTDIDGVTLTAESYYALTAKIDRTIKVEFKRREVFVFSSYYIGFDIKPEIAEITSEASDSEWWVSYKTGK